MPTEASATRSAARERLALVSALAMAERNALATRRAALRGIASTTSKARSAGSPWISSVISLTLRGEIRAYFKIACVFMF